MSDHLRQESGTIPKNDWESLFPEPANPELPVWVITCDRCGTTYKNNECPSCGRKVVLK